MPFGECIPFHSKLTISDNTGIVFCFTYILLCVILFPFHPENRDRADVLREEDPLLQSIDWSISSLGSAMGASDKRRTDGGGVEAATTSVLANYFLKSHGGAHGLQSLCSLLATMASVGAVVFRKSPLGFTFLKQAMMFAMIKHVSGLLAGASLAAKAVPKIGLAEARQWVEQLVLDPISQYVFYTSVILLWLPPKQRLDYCWWWKQFWAAPALVGPILVREVIGILMVVSDVLVLCSVGEEGAIQTVLKVSQSIINAVMSLLVSPQTWRGADPAERQAILAKLVSRVSLCFEVIVGALLSMDFVRGLFETAFTSGPNRPPLKYALIRLLCVRLYVHFLYVRRKKIAKLASKLRGGAAQLPFWFLDIVYAPVKSMGLERESMDNEELTWRDYMSVGLGLSN